VPGLLLHAVFEKLDFPNAGAEAIRLEIARQWPAFPLDAAAHDWIEPLARTVTAALDTPLPLLVADAPAVRLRDVTGADRLPEMRFVFPAALDREQARAISAADLAAVFRRHGGTPAMTEYAARLAELSLRDFRGYWGGAIDLAFRQHGRFFVVDYKSNRLGTAFDDYAPPRLAREMAESHYILQYHLYCVALHRFLAQRVPAYGYETHFGGVYYLFLRGVRASGATTTGVYAHRPPWALIHALDGLFTGGRRGGA
jgi:exodeoxyribonuclease V beta subunit